MTSKSEWRQGRNVTGGRRRRRLRPETAPVQGRWLQRRRPVLVAGDDLRAGVCRSSLNVAKAHVAAQGERKTAGKNLADPLPVGKVQGRSGQTL